ncbi:MAG TPA: glycosyltransferase [Mycobacteriales bacterium]|nr:glycosyltransferase [Mycobacteriales bacterium]
MTARRLAVVVPTRDRPEQLRTCLTALRAALGPDDELIVSDSASRDRAGVAAVVEAAGGRLVRCEVKGTSRARNAGWRATTAQEVAFVDDDVVVDASWAGAIRGRTNEEVAFVSGRTVAPAEFTGQAVSVTTGRPADVIGPHVGGDFLAANNLLVRRDVLEAVGGFDERLGPGTWLQAGEDLELLDRVREAGFSGRYVHEALAEHEQWRDAAALRRLQWAYGKGMGARVAAASRRSPREGWALLPQMLRLGGLRTLWQRLPGTSRPLPEVAVANDPPPADVSGWAGPLLWRAGAWVGFLVGLGVLSPRGPRGPAL